MVGAGYGYGYGYESAPAKLVGGDKVAWRVLGAKELLARGRVAERGVLLATPVVLTKC
jgi:hypothetical protein